MRNIEIYTRDKCGLCQDTKLFLITNNVMFNEIVIDKDITLEEIKTKFPEVKQLPIVTVGGKYIGGKKETINYVQSF